MQTGSRRTARHIERHEWFVWRLLNVDSLSLQCLPDFLKARWLTSCRAELAPAYPGACCSSPCHCLPLCLCQPLHHRSHWAVCEVAGLSTRSQIFQPDEPWQPISQIQKKKTKKNAANNLPLSSKFCFCSRRFHSRQANWSLFWQLTNIS